MKRITLDTIKNSERSSVLLDNLTLSLSDSLYQKDFGIDLSSEKLADASVLSEVCAISTLVDALILYDTIYVPSDYANKWLDSLPEIHSIVTLVNISPSEHSLMREQMKKMAISYSKDKHFHRYIRYLQSKHLEGVFLRTVSHYHGIVVNWVQEAASHIPEENNKHGGFDSAYRRASRELEPALSFLEHFGGYHEKNTIPLVSMLLASGAFFYQVVASKLGIAYLPHPFRSPFCIFDTWVDRAIKGVTYSPMRLLERKRSETAQGLNNLLGDGICDIYIPALLAMVLKQSKHPKDILLQAIVIRNAPSTIQFRKVLLTLVNTLKAGNIREVSLCLKQVQEIVQVIGEDNVPQVNLAINFSHSADLAIPGEQEHGESKSLLLPDKLLFIKSVWDSIAEVASLEQELTRIWGDGFKQHIDKVWTWSQIDPKKIEKELLSSRGENMILPEQSDNRFMKPNIEIVSILFLAAEPIDTSRLRLGEEIREIQEKLQLAKLRERFELHQRMSVRPVDISQALLDVQPQIVHFSGHGTRTGALCFENQIGEIQPIESDALAALFEQFANQVHCVVLNACYSEIQANAIAKHINFVIGMNHAIGDRAAIAFTVGFYQALGAGRSIEDAYKLGCVQIGLQGIPEHLTPVLIKKG